MFMNKGYLVFPIVALIAASCAQMAQYSAGRQEFQDGIYFKATDKPKAEPVILTEEEIAARAAENIRQKNASKRDTLVIVYDPESVNTAYWNLNFGYPYYGYYYPYYSPYYSYWHSPYYYHHG